MEHDLFEAATGGAVPDLIRKSADERDGVFEVTVDDFAGILERAGVATYDPIGGTLRVLGYPFADCLDNWRERSAEQVEQRSAGLAGSHKSGAA